MLDGSLQSWRQDEGEKYRRSVVYKTQVLHVKQVCLQGIQGVQKELT